jgi:hypothetical protein
MPFVMRLSVGAVNSASWLCPRPKHAAREKSKPSTFSAALVV